jgi:hypothetical protein
VIDASRCSCLELGYMQILIDSWADAAQLRVLVDHEARPVTIQRMEATMSAAN